MDLSKFAISEKPVKFELEFDGEKTGAVFYLYGTDSDDFKAADSRINKEVLKIAAKGGRLDLSRIDPDKAEEFQIARLCACIASWEGVEFKGKKLDCTDENKAMILQSLPFVRDQIQAFVTKRENFMSAS